MNPNYRVTLIGMINSLRDADIETGLLPEEGKVAYNTIIMALNAEFDKLLDRYNGDESSAYIIVNTTAILNDLGSYITYHYMDGKEMTKENLNIVRYMRKIHRSLWIYLQWKP